MTPTPRSHASGDVRIDASRHPCPSGRQGTSGGCRGADEDGRRDGMESGAAQAKGARRPARRGATCVV